jgi:hypothetical protein
MRLQALVAEEGVFISLCVGIVGYISLKSYSFYVARVFKILRLPCVRVKSCYVRA